MTKCDYLKNASVESLNLSGELRANHMKMWEIFEFFNNYLFAKPEILKKEALRMWKSFVTFEMPVKTIYHSVNYEGSQSW